MKHLRYVCLLAAPRPSYGRGSGKAQEHLQLASFDQVWNTVRERHWDKTKTGVAWDHAREELRPEAERATSAKDVRPVIQRLLAKLGQSHFGIIPAEAYEKLEHGSDGEPRPLGVNNHLGPALRGNYLRAGIALSKPPSFTPKSTFSGSVPLQRSGRRCSCEDTILRPTG